jgi:hypothetical protein
MSIYMSFRAAQDHNKATARDTTPLTASSFRQEDPAAMTRHHSSCFPFTCRSFILVNLVMNYIAVKLVLLLLVVNYIVNLMICV